MNGLINTQRSEYELYPSFFQLDYETDYHGYDISSSDRYTDYLTFTSLFLKSRFELTDVAADSSFAHPALPTISRYIHRAFL